MASGLDAKAIRHSSGTPFVPMTSKGGRPAELGAVKASYREDGTMAELPEGGNGKPRRRITAKAASEQTAKKVKSTIHLSREADQRLDIHCTMMGFDRSGLVEKLINDHLRRYVVSDRGGDVAAGDAA